MHCWQDYAGDYQAPGRREQLTLGQSTIFSKKKMGTLMTRI